MAFTKFLRSLAKSGWTTKSTDLTAEEIDGNFLQLEDDLETHKTDTTAHGVDQLVPKTRQVIAGNGLSGGGDLTADRTFTFNGDLSDLADVTGTDSPAQASFLFYNETTGGWEANQLQGSGDIEVIQNSGFVTLNLAPDPFRFNKLADGSPFASSVDLDLATTRFLEVRPENNVTIGVKNLPITTRAQAYIHVIHRFGKSVSFTGIGWEGGSVPALTDRSTKTVNTNSTYGADIQSDFLIDGTFVEPGVEKSVAFNGDGTRAYGIVGADIVQLDLATAYDISSATAKSATLSTGFGIGADDFALTPSGTKLFATKMGDAGIGDFTLSTAFELSTATKDREVTMPNSGDANSLTFNGDGTLVAIADGVMPAIRVYDLSTAYDLTTATENTSVSWDSGGDVTAFGLVNIEFTDSGNKLVAIEDTSPWRMFEFDFGTPYDLGSITREKKVDFGPEFTSNGYSPTPKSVVQVGQNDLVFVVESNAGQRIWRVSSGAKPWVDVVEVQQLTDYSVAGRLVFSVPIDAEEV